MVRKMAYIGTSFFIGLFCASFFVFKINIIIGVALILIAILYAIIINKKNLTVSVCIISFAVALLDFSVYQLCFYNPVLKYSGNEIEFSGKITEINYLKNDIASYTIKGKINGKNSATILYRGNYIDCEYNDFVTLKGTAEKFEDTYFFPAESYYKAKGIYLQISDGEFNIQKNANFSIVKTIMNYRDYLYDIVYTYLPGEEGALFNAMLFGDKNGIDDNVKSLMFRTGIGHIMSVSGTHLSVTSLFLLWIIKNISKNKWINFIIVEIAIILFTIFAGLSVSVIRSAVMMTLILAGSLFKRKADIYNSLGLAVILLSFFNPFIIKDSSFVLSVTGVFGMGVVAPYITEKINFNFKGGKPLKNLIFMLAATIPILPISTFYFDEVSIISPLTNVFLIPICSVILICGILLAITGGIKILAVPLLLISGLCCKIVLILCKLIGNLDYSYFSVSGKSIRIFMFLAIVILILSYVIFKSRKILAITSAVLITFFISLSLISTLMDKNTVHIAVLGDDDTTVIVSRCGSNACILSIENSAESLDYVKKYLSQNGIKKIKVLFITDSVEAGISAFDNGLKLYKVENILLPENTFILDGTKILSIYPQKIDLNDCVIDMDRYEISINKQNYLISTDNFSLLIGDGTELLGQDLYILYDNSLDKDCLSDKYLNLENEKNYSGYEIVVNPDGKYKVRGIKNATRQ